MSSPLPLEHAIAAKLDVLIEGIADHKVTAYNRELLGKEIMADFKQLIVETVEEARDER